MAERLGPVELFAGQPLPLEALPSPESLVSPYEGFLFRSSNRDPKSVGLATPLDELTKLPLPIIISEPRSKTANTCFSDYHHHYHPERDLVHGNDADMALRRARGQDLPRWLHEHYHKYFAGPEFPTNRADTFASVVLACAGVVPRKALDFTGKYEEPKIVEVWDNNRYQRIVSSTKHEAEKAGRSGGVFRAQIGIFFANYAIEQAFEEAVSERVIDEFLRSTDPERRKVLGSLMLSEAIKISVEPVVPIHQALKRENIARKRKTDLVMLVKDYFVRSRRPDYYAAIDRKLSVA